MSCRTKGNPDSANWEGPYLFGRDDGRFHALALTQGSFGGNLELIALQDYGAVAYWRDRQRPQADSWDGPLNLDVQNRPVAEIEGQPALIQQVSSDGVVGDFVLAAPSRRGGIVVYRRDNRHGPEFLWSGPERLSSARRPQHNDRFDAVWLAYGAPGELEMIAMARPGGRLFATRTVRGRWQALIPVLLDGRQLAAGDVHNFTVAIGKHGPELLLPDERGGLQLYWRDDDMAARPWHGPAHFGLSAGRFDAVAMSYTISDQLEVLARQGNELHRFWREPGSTAWQGPDTVSCSDPG